MARRGRILVVAEVNARTALAELLRDEGFEVETAADAFKALGKCDAFAPLVVLTDLKMAGMDGLALIKKIRAMEEAAAVIVMTAFGAVTSAVEAMHAGAAGYLTKPVNVDELLLLVDRVLEHQALRAERRRLRERLRDKFAPRNIVGASPVMNCILEVVDQVGPSNATVLITGERGTGKELIASAIHQRSLRASGPFIKLPCAALAESLRESGRLGHLRGSFTGAVQQRTGGFQMADGGTLFLDEIAEISPAVQVRLLRFLQEHELERAGSGQTLRGDVRVIAATSKNLRDEVARGRFRADLFHRLNMVALEMPALRDRRSDIPALAKFFIDKYAKERGRATETVSPEALDTLMAYDWPSNVQELENAIERAVMMAPGPAIEPRHLPPSVKPSASAAGGAPVIPGCRFAEIEKYAILETLAATGGSTAKASEMLGISVRTIKHRLREYSAAPRSAVVALIRSAGSA